MCQLFVNGAVFDGEAVIRNCVVEVVDGKVHSLSQGPVPSKGDEVIDLGGHLLAPGFIDVQVNGGGGVLFNTATDLDALKTILAAHRRFGTTSLLPTFISDDWEGMLRASTFIREGISRRLPGLRGVHFEGPYISPERRGIHHENQVRSVDAGALDMLTSGGMGVVVATMAPERVPHEFIRVLADAGVKVCVGHTAATYDQTLAGINAGMIGFTHLFNAMSPFNSREPGVVGAALSHQDSWAGMIADGFHVHFASLRVALAAKQRGRMMLITDAMPTVGAENKSFVLQGVPITAEGGCCVSPDGTLAGSDLDMATAVRNTVEHLRQPLEEALRMASLYPAGFLGLDDHLGRIAPGYEADFVLLDRALKVQQTWIGGCAAV